MRAAQLSVQGWLRYAVVRDLIPPKVESILEIGCGRGALGSILARSYRYTGLEPDAEAYHVARATIDGVFPLREDEYESADGFDLVCAFEVLEHIEDDEAALRAWRRRVRGRGWLMISVPAGEHRFGATDQRVGHVRRYSRERILGLLGRTGFAESTVVGYGFPVGNAIRLVSDILAARSPAMPRDEATATSGRWLQPRERSALVRRAVASPFVRTQRLFAESDLNTGLVVRARAC